MDERAGRAGRAEAFGASLLDGEVGPNRRQPLDQLVAGDGLFLSGLAEPLRQIAHVAGVAQRRNCHPEHLPGALDGRGPRLLERQLLFAQLDVVGQIVELRRPRASVPPEREIGLVRVDQDDQVRGGFRKAHARRLVDRLAELRDGQRLGQPLEVAEPVAAEDEMGLSHLAEPQRDGDLRHRRAERLVDGDASFLLLHGPRQLLVDTAQRGDPGWRAEVRVRRVLTGAHLIEQAPESVSQVRRRGRPRLEGGIERLEVLCGRVRLVDRAGSRILHAVGALQVVDQALSKLALLIPAEARARTPGRLARGASRSLVTALRPARGRS